MPLLQGISDQKARSGWTSTAFIVESVLLLVFLVSSLAVLTNIFFASLNRSVESRTLDAATIAATSIAEHFAADPSEVEERTQLGDLLVVCTVNEEPRGGGVLYHAAIDVFDNADDEAAASGSDGVDEAASEAGVQPVYSITTSCYRSGVS